MKSISTAQMSKEAGLVTRLALRALEIAGKRLNEIERFCWMTIHEYRHGTMPSEYDIREVDEELYLAVLERARINIKS